MNVYVHVSTYVRTVHVYVCARARMKVCVGEGVSSLSCVSN